MTPLGRFRRWRDTSRFWTHAREVWPKAWPATVILFITFCAIGFLLAQGSQEANLVAAIGMTIAIVTALIQGRGEGEGPEQDRRSLGTIAIALPTAAVLALFAGGAIWLYRGNGPLDVLDRVSVQQPSTGLGYPVPKTDRDFTATVEIRSPRSRDHLTVVFQVSDHDPHQQNCVPNGGTRLEVTLDQQGNRRTVRSGLQPGRPVTVDFTTPPHAVRLRVRVTNEKDRSCVMNLSVSRAVYATWPSWLYPAAWF
ncbi:hypothetical protein ACRYCC_31505 [Actinomadura scrupuli]|uniref:hypothetical protein n=1 Tax=Actinomadura scrupuli TaxID=559629 RepID=UPI003D991C14